MPYCARVGNSEEEVDNDEEGRVCKWEGGEVGVESEEKDEKMPWESEIGNGEKNKENS